MRADPFKPGTLPMPGTSLWDQDLWALGNSLAANTLTATQATLYRLRLEFFFSQTGAGLPARLRGHLPGSVCHSA